MAGAAPQTVYRDEFVAGFAQRQSLLKDTCTDCMMVKGNIATFLVAASTGTAVTRGVNGLIPSADNSNTQVSATLVEKHDLREMTGFNIFQSQSDQRAIMQMNAMSTINRDIDQIILTELGNGTLDTGSAATATKNMINKAFAQLMINGVAMDGNLYAAISPAFLMYLMDIPSFSSADFVTVKPHVSLPGWNAASEKKAGQGWYDWMGVKWVVSNQISGIGTSSETCFMYHKASIGHAANTKEMDSAIGYDEKQQISWARCSIFHGVKILQNTGIVRLIHDGSAFVAT